ncbi:MAG: radical SAM protein [bacterium]
MEGIPRPGYIELYEKGELQKRRDAARALLSPCTLCPRTCKVDRLRGERGFCRTGALPVVSSYGPHFGEESPLVGEHGSGTIFITHCNLGCIFCQNYEISHLGEGQEISPEDLSRIMLDLQRRGCHNINFVSPTHVVPFILDALPFAIDRGLTLPLVYNTGGYDSLASIRLLEGVFDIYMPDFKFAGAEEGKQYAHAPDYFQVACAALAEMHRQVGDLQLDSRGIAWRGLLIRHLVMPEGVAGTDKVMAYISQRLSKDTYINIMDQYRPCGEARLHPEIDRAITGEEFAGAIRIAHSYGLHRLDDRRRFPLPR